MQTGQDVVTLQFRYQAEFRELVLSAYDRRCSVPLVMICRY